LISSKRRGCDESVIARFLLEKLVKTLRSMRAKSIKSWDYR
jgi:hypothetical protein